MKNGGFSGDIIQNSAIFHCHVWLLEGNRDNKVDRGYDTVYHGVKCIVVMMDT